MQKCKKPHSYIILVTNVVKDSSAWRIVSLNIGNLNRPLKLSVSHDYNQGATPPVCFCLVLEGPNSAEKNQICKPKYVQLFSLILAIHSSCRNDHFNEIKFESVQQNEKQLLTLKNWKSNSKVVKDKQKISITFDSKSGPCHKYFISLNGIKTGRDCENEKTSFHSN